MCKKIKFNKGKTKKPVKCKSSFSLFCIKSSTSYHTGDVLTTYYINLSSIENKNKDISDILYYEEVNLLSSSSFILFVIMVKKAIFVINVIRVKLLNKRYSFIYKHMDCFR